MHVDPGGREWPYQQLARQIRERIEDGTYPPGRMIPSLQRLAAESGLTLKTAQKAVQLLEAEGLVDTVPSRGTFVREPE